MRDKRPVDELSIEELERILAIRKREERQKRMDKLRRDGRVVANGVAAPPAAAPAEVLAPESSVPKAAVYVPARPPVARPDLNGVEPRFEEDFDAPLPARKTEGEVTAWRRFVSRATLAVEIAAVIGLVYLGYNLYVAIGKLEDETATAVAIADEQRRAVMPTLEPTPQLTLEAIVLPGGHTPPTAPGGAQFNYDEIPAHLRPVVQNQILQPVIYRPPVTEETALRLIIPKLNVDQTIVQGVDWEALRLGIGQLGNGAEPGDDSGNLVLAAHNDIYGEYFRYLDRLEAGDQFQVQTRTQIFTYTVTGSEIVGPNDVHVMDHTDTPTATLISCYPYQVNDKRYIVFAAREDA